MRRRRCIKVSILLGIIFVCVSKIFASSSEVKEYKSKYVLSENINEGIRVSIIKSDIYDNFQDEYVAVDVKVENSNSYASAKVKVEAIGHDDFTIIGAKESSFDLQSYDIGETIFEYRYNRSRSPYIPTDNESEYIRGTRSVVYKRIDDRAGYSRASNSSIYVRGTRSEMYKYTMNENENRRGIGLYILREGDSATGSIIGRRQEREKEIIEREEYRVEKEEGSSRKKFIYILAIVLIVIFVVLLAIYFIRRYIKTHDEFYSMLLMIGLSLILSICTITLKVKNIYAYNQQTFMMNTEYSHYYLCEVWNGGIPWTFKFKVSYEYIGEIERFSEKQDSDGDGLVDNYEVYFLTDINNVDTDGDYITDYDEIYVIDTDPLKEDTDGDGVLDSDFDYDGDGLSNKEEMGLGTFMDSIDTDSDLLTDYEEVRVYHTDPLKVDTDNDLLTDYEEVEIAKKLGISDISSVDKDMKIEQSLSRDSMEKDIYMRNVVKVSVEGTVPGLIDKHIKLKVSNNESLINADSVLGLPIYIESDYSDKVRIFDTTLSGGEISAEVVSGEVFVIDGIQYINDILAYKKENVNRK